MSMIDYFKQVRAEMKHVSWPSRALTITYTVVVIAVSAGVAIYLGLLDYAFSTAVKYLI